VTALVATLGFALATGQPAGAVDAGTAAAASVTAAAAAVPLVAGDPAAGEDVREFHAFCAAWMAKLQERNVYNAAHIVWTKSGPGVVGDYIRYGSERTCTAREEPGKDPIGKITYREIKYRKEGPTESAAMEAADTILEQTEVTEIFRYAKGRWQY